MGYEGARSAGVGGVGGSVKSKGYGGGDLAGDGLHAIGSATPVGTGCVDSCGRTTAAAACGATPRAVFSTP